MLSKGRISEIVIETYRILYKEATPSADFDKLRDECCQYIDENGNTIKLDEPLSTDEVIRRGWRKDIQFHKYYLDRNRYKEIVDEQIRKYKIKGRDVSVFSMSVYLGCGPTSKKPE